MEINVSSGIIESWYNDLKACLDVDIAIAGAGPSALVASYYLAKKGLRVAIFERKLAPGGGMWGGAMMFNKIVIQKEAISILEEFGINYRAYKDVFVADSVEATASLIYHAVNANVSIFNCVSVEDVVVKDDKVRGLVINWTPVKLNSMHVDPLAISSKVVIDGTGHDAEVCRLLTSKNKYKLRTTSGEVIGEKSLNVIIAEKATVDNTGEVYPGLYVSGMAANAVSGSCRMGPIFGGMLLSGKKCAELINADIGNQT